MTKVRIKILGVLVLAVLALVGIAFYATSTHQSSTLDIKLYDKNGMPIDQRPLFSIVTSSSGQRVEGVGFLQFIASAENTGDIPLEVSIDSASPQALAAALPSTKFELNSGQNAVWESQLIPSKQFDDTTQTFTVRIRGDYSYAGEAGILLKEGSLTYSFLADPNANLNILLLSSLGNDSGLGTNGTQKETGTSCNLNNECQSNVCTGEVSSVSFSNGNYCGKSSDNNYYLTESSDPDNVFYRVECPSVCDYCKMNQAWEQIPGTTDLRLIEGLTEITVPPGEYVQCLGQYGLGRNLYPECVTTSDNMVCS